MAQVKTSFFCKNCGAQYAKWQGQCNACKEWNTITEEVLKKEPHPVWKGKEKPGSSRTRPQLLKDIQADDHIRISTFDQELDRVLGGGIVPGSIILLGGEPGIGKSTLLLQVALQLPQKVLYVSGEESAQQIKLRSERIKNNSSKCYILNETNTQRIFAQIAQIEPNVLIIDSIQTLHTQSIDSSAGSVSQIRECTSELLTLAKESHIPVLLVGHITKDGLIAGPKILEHMVDTVLHFEGDRNHMYRIIRAPKNRFGSTSELGIYEMESRGLRPIANPSELLISNQSSQLSGHAIAATVEGVRPMLIEVQALVSTAVYGTPQRSCTGFNSKRLNMLLAVLEKRAGFKLGSKDVFLNIAGGIRIEDPALDLAVAMAILSSSLDIVIPKGLCFAAEIGLSGELRNVPKVDIRVQEAEKLGFESMVTAQKSKTATAQIEVKISETLKEVVTLIF